MDAKVCDGCGKTVTSSEEIAGLDTTICGYTSPNPGPELTIEIDGGDFCDECSEAISEKANAAVERAIANLQGKDKGSIDPPKTIYAVKMEAFELVQALLLLQMSDNSKNKIESNLGIDSLHRCKEMLRAWVGGPGLHVEPDARDDLEAAMKKASLT